eukprot:TRINITY_DN19751_c0_g1_i1.p1 TRINITY_DN19751_c0_g1~~TRINITY_DN19751_c0_g1_i1.p1  ORF type:complete len:332 (-),score=47.50 TRINITY_DN19751_c0_g1_i1:535-1530(-)
MALPPSEGDGLPHESPLLHVMRNSPLAVSYPSPMLLLNYPLVVSNVTVLAANHKDNVRKPGSSGLAATIRLLKLMYEAEGFKGLYRGGHLYLLHQGLRDLLRFFSDRCIGFLERTCSNPATKDSACQQAISPGSELDIVEPQIVRRRYLSRLAIKYCIDGLCYPVLLASCRAIVLANDEESTVDRMRLWWQEEGLWSLFGGLTASLLSSALEEAMEMMLSVSIDKAAHGSNVDVSDRLVLKACGGSVVSIFTAPINYVGVIQRCQSKLPGLLEPRPLLPIITRLPWRGSFHQLLMFGGILAINVRLIQWKIQLQAQERVQEMEEEDEEYDE